MTRLRYPSGQAIFVPCTHRPSQHLGPLLGRQVAPCPRQSTALKVDRRRADICRVQAAAGPASSVKILLQGRHVQVTDSIDAYVREKVTKATHKYESAIRKVDVKLSVRGGDRGGGPKEHLAEVTIFTLRTGIVRVEDAEDNMYASIDLVCDKIARKMARVKDHAIAVGKWPGRARGHFSQGELADQTISLDDDDNEDEGSFQEYNSEEYGTPLPENFDAFDSARPAISNPPADLLRQKEIYLSPLSLTEAILSLDRVGHDFFVFQEEQTGQVQVVYRRKEEGYGVIVPHVPSPDGA